MAKHEAWELELVPLMQVDDLLDVFEVEGHTLAGVPQREGEEASDAQNKVTSRDPATKSDPEAPIIDMAVRKATQSRVQIRSYPMDARGASRCLREATFLRKSALNTDTAPPQFRRALSHFIHPLGVWTSSNSTYLHVRTPTHTASSSKRCCRKSKFALEELPRPKNVFCPLLALARTQNGRTKRRLWSPRTIYNHTQGGTDIRDFLSFFFVASLRGAYFFFLRCAYG